MPLYFCIIPNRGARIGHQTDDHFRIVTYCKKNGFIFVYHPFTCNSENFEKILALNTLYDNNYSNTFKNVDEIIKIKDVTDKLEGKSIHEKLLEIHNYSKKIMLFDDIGGNELFNNNYNINNDDIIETKKLYRGVLLKYYKNIVKTDYICIHVRCGDIVNDESRYLSVDYFIDKYNYLITLFPELIKLPIYVITENNFKDDNIFYKKIKNCKIIKTDEITSFYYLVNCKYLIAARSGFSNLAYILGNMKVIQPPFDWNCYWDNLI
jgi:hypothetical protein